VCAPGVNVKSLDFSTTNGYCLKSGTSMATPCVAGVIALMLSKDHELTPEQVDEILERTAVPLSTHKSNDFGSGRIDALAAVNAVGDDGIYEIDNDEIQIYPNPAYDVVTIVGAHHVRSFDDGKIELVNTDGKPLKINKISNNQIDISDLPNGMYLLKIGKNSQKIIINR
jgi:subtilisin family serine protease